MGTMRIHMPKIPSLKSIQIHIECECGRNEIHPYEQCITKRALLAEGFKYKTDKKTKAKFYFRYDKFICNFCIKDGLIKAGVTLENT